MKRQHIFFSLGSLFAVVCLSLCMPMLSSCGDDDEESTVIVQPDTLTRQWETEGDGVEAQSIVYDMRKAGKLYVYQQPTATYAAEAEMNPNYYYRTQGNSLLAFEVDTKTGVLYVTTSMMGRLKITDVTPDGITIDGVRFRALANPVSSIGEWKVVDKPVGPVEARKK